MTSKILLGYHVGRIHVVFSLPTASLPLLFHGGMDIPSHLTYVDWYMAFPDTPDPNHLLFKISPVKDHEGHNICSIVPLANM